MLLGVSPLGVSALGAGQDSTTGGGGIVLDPAPGSLWPGYAYSADTLHIPRAALAGLAEADADATTGDWRKIALALQSRFWLHWVTLAAEDRPQAMIVKQPSSSAISYGTFAEQAKLTFSFEFYVGFGTPTLLDEPA